MLPNLNILIASKLVDLKDILPKCCDNLQCLVLDLESLHAEDFSQIYSPCPRLKHIIVRPSKYNARIQIERRTYLEWKFILMHKKTLESIMIFSKYSTLTIASLIKECVTIKRVLICPYQGNQDVLPNCGNVDIIEDHETGVEAVRKIFDDCQDVLQMTCLLQCLSQYDDEMEEEVVSNIFCLWN